MRAAAPLRCAPVPDRPQRVDLRAVRAPVGERRSGLGPAAPSAEEQALGRERLHQVLADLQALPERSRGALVLRELCGLTHEEIAVALQTAVGGARQSILEARKELREYGVGRDTACAEIREKISARTPGAPARHVGKRGTPHPAPADPPGQAKRTGATIHLSPGQLKKAASIPRGHAKRTARPAAPLPGTRSGMPTTVDGWHAAHAGTLAAPHPFTPHSRKWG